MKQEEEEDIVARNVAIKAEHVKEDEFDEGKRQILNFGHTIGHAIEALSDFSIRHGHAVAMGMVAMARAAWRHGLSDEDCTGPLCQALIHNNLPCNCPYSAKDLATAAMADKKRRAERNDHYPAETHRKLLQIPDSCRTIGRNSFKKDWNRQKNARCGRAYFARQSVGATPG